MAIAASIEANTARLRCVHQDVNAEYTPPSYTFSRQILINIFVVVVTILLQCGWPDTRGSSSLNWNARQVGPTFRVEQPNEEIPRHADLPPTPNPHDHPPMPISILASDSRAAAVLDAGH